MMKLGFFVLLALVAAANAAGDLDGYKKPHRFGDCGGHDVKHITRTTLPVCAKECGAWADCKTFLFVNHGVNSYCWLKNSNCPKLSATNHKEYHFYNKCSKPLCNSPNPVPMCSSGTIFKNVYSLDKDGCKVGCVRYVCERVPTPAPEPTPAKPTECSKPLCNRPIAMPRCSRGTILKKVYSLDKDGCKIGCVRYVCERGGSVTKPAPATTPSP